VSESDDNGKQLSMSASEVSHIMRYPNRRILYFTLQNQVTKFKMADGHHVDQYLFRFHWQ